MAAHKTSNPLRTGLPDSDPGLPPEQKGVDVNQSSYKNPKWDPGPKFVLELKTFSDILDIFNLCDEP